MHRGQSIAISHSGVRRRDLVFSDALLDEVAGGGWREAGSDAKQGIESRGCVAATVLLSGPANNRRSRFAAYSTRALPNWQTSAAM